MYPAKLSFKNESEIKSFTDNRKEGKEGGRKKGKERKEGGKTGGRRKERKGRKKEGRMDEGLDRLDHLFVQSHTAIR